MAIRPMARTLAQTNLFHLLRVVVHPGALLVVRPRVVEHEPPVFPEVEHRLVVVARDALPDAGHGDRLLDDLVIVGV